MTPPHDAVLKAQASKLGWMTATALLFGSGRRSHHRSCVAAIVMDHNGGRSRLLISRKMNPPICVASDPTPHGTITVVKPKVHPPHCVHHKYRLPLHSAQV